MRKTTQPQRSFTIVEMLVVVTMIAMIASMAIPRMSRGAVGASQSALAGDLNLVRNAILYYAIEHGNTFPGPDAGSVVKQLTAYSDAAGNTSATRTTVFVHGPYLAAIPPCPLGPKAGSSDVCIDATHSPPQFKTGNSAGWVYNPTTGEFYPNIPSEELTFLIGGAAMGMSGASAK